MKAHQCLYPPDFRECGFDCSKSGRLDICGRDFNECAKEGLHPQLVGPIGHDCVTGEGALNIAGHVVAEKR
jgi:hypothetical protein